MTGRCIILVLSRRLDESILIGEDIVVTVVDIRDGKVRLGITAPVEIEVDRREIREIKRFNARKAQEQDQGNGEDVAPPLE